MRDVIRLRHGRCAQSFAVVDLTRPEALEVWRELLEGRTADVVYSDPPWGSGNEAYWRTRVGLAPAGGLAQGWSAAAQITGARHVIVETSVDPRRQLAVTVDAPLQSEWTAVYGSPRRPNLVRHYGSAPLNVDLSGLTGEALVVRALSSVPGARSVADPCTGLGTTSRAAHYLGWDCYGTELDPRRLARTIQWLVRQGYTFEEGEDVARRLA